MFLTLAMFGAGPRRGRQPVGFTLTELVVVMLVIILLAGLVVGMSGYGQRRAKVGRAMAEVAQLESVIEIYRTDLGHYPTSTEVRVSYYWIYEAINSMLLCEQLTRAGYAPAIERYVRSVSLGTNLPATVYLGTGCGVVCHGVEALFDPWDKPYNYYCPSPPVTTPRLEYPLDPAVPCNGKRFVIGGQRNPASFDLWSYGPDCFTCAFVAGADGYLNNPERAVDDIPNFH